MSAGADCYSSHLHEKCLVYKVQPSRSLQPKEHRRLSWGHHVPSGPHVPLSSSAYTSIWKRTESNRSILWLLGTAFTWTLLCMCFVRVRTYFVCLLSIIAIRDRRFILSLLIYLSLFQVKLPLCLKIEPVFLILCREIHNYWFIYWLILSFLLDRSISWPGLKTVIRCVSCTPTDRETIWPAMCRMVFLQYSSARGMTFMSSRPQVTRGFPWIA